MAQCIALRVDKGLDDVLSFLDMKGVGGFGVRECAVDNEHWHFYLETDAFKNLQSFRVALTRAVPELKGNGAYSATEVKDKDKYWRYMCKGDTDGGGCWVVWRHSLVFTEEYVDQLHEEYWQENRRLKSRKVGSVIDAVIDECKRSGVAWDDRTAIARIYVTEVSKRAKPFNQFAAKSGVNAVQLALCPDDSAIRMFAELL